MTVLIAQANKTLYADKQQEAHATIDVKNEFLLQTRNTTQKYHAENSASVHSYRTQSATSRERRR